MRQKIRKGLKNSALTIVIHFLAWRISCFSHSVHGYIDPQQVQLPEPFPRSIPRAAISSSLATEFVDQPMPFNPTSQVIRSLSKALIAIYVLATISNGRASKE